jgi:hypothetical protein
MFQNIFREKFEEAIYNEERVYLNLVINTDGDKQGK